MNMISIKQMITVTNMPMTSLKQVFVKSNANNLNILQENANFALVFVRYMYLCLVCILISPFFTVEKVKNVRSLSQLLIKMAGSV